MKSNTWCFRIASWKQWPALSAVAIKSVCTLRWQRLTKVISVSVMAVLWCCLTAFSYANSDSLPPLKLYIDADRTGTSASGIAIEQGIRTALQEVGNRLGGYPVEIAIRDHRGSSLRSRMHLEEYLTDSRALVVFAGLHSPPLLAHKNFINTNQILILDPWAAAGPITRPASGPNWIFRLSVDDTKAGRVIANTAIKAEGFRKPYLLLEETGWGKSNLKTMTGALKDMAVQPAGTQWFNWSLGENAARIKLRQIYQSGADVIFLVANAPEGKTFAKAMLQLPVAERLPIRSHWGITGGDFPEVITADQRKELDLAFIQTRFSFINHGDEPFAQHVFRQAQELFPTLIKRREDLRAPTGFIHAYDLTRLLIAAVAQVELTGELRLDRQRVHAALENLQQPVEGLIKTYRRPFQPYTNSLLDAHEALDEADLVMGYYGDNNEIILRVP